MNGQQSLQKMLMYPLQLLSTPNLMSSPLILIGMHIVLQNLFPNTDITSYHLELPYQFTVSSYTDSGINL